MIHAAALLAVLLAGSQPDAAPTQADVETCRQEAETQREINQCGGLELKLADSELNATYKAVIEAHKDDEVFVARLRDAQRAWASASNIRLGNGTAGTALERKLVGELLGRSAVALCPATHQPAFARRYRSQ